MAKPMAGQGEESSEAWRGVYFTENFGVSRRLTGRGFEEANEAKKYLV